MYRAIMALIILLYGGLSGAARIATTDDGKKVLLNENGTWRYLDDKTAPSETATGRSSLLDIVKQNGDYDFRRVRWGMTRKEVLASESKPPLKDGASQTEYIIKFLEYDCSVIYSFADETLIRAELTIRQPHVDPAFFYQDYEHLKGSISTPYGDAAENRCDWNNEMYRNDKSKWGFAVSLGFLTCRTRWQTDRTRITLAISGGNHRITTTLEYCAAEAR